MSKGNQFEDLLVWQKSMELVTKVYRLCQQGPFARDWGLRDQVQRAAVSVPANIAEGYGRASRKEYVQFLMTAKGSAGELRCPASLIRDSLEISRMLKGLANSLKQERV